jgi:hypothetical protein
MIEKQLAEKYKTRLADYRQKTWKSRHFPARRPIRDTVSDGPDNA